MTEADWAFPEQRAELLRWAVVWAAAVTLGHFALGPPEDHVRHGIHVLLAGLYFVPILFAAVAREARGGLMMAGAVSAVYLVHVALRQPLASGQLLDELALVAGYLVVGGSIGGMVTVAHRRRQERDEVLAGARRREIRIGLEALVEALGARDPALAEHSRRVAELAELLGRRLGLDRERCAELHLAGLLHDVGKIGLGDDVLFGNGGLSQAQRELVHAHPRRAAELVRALGGGEELAEVVLSHHECPDGSGYPRGLRGEEIPLAARVLKVADVFAALTEKRRYRASEPPREALATARSMAPDKLDPAALEALARVVDDGWWNPKPEEIRAVGPGAPDDLEIAGA